MKGHEFKNVSYSLIFGKKSKLKTLSAFAVLKCFITRRDICSHATVLPCAHWGFETSYTLLYSEPSTSTHTLLNPVRQQHIGETDRTKTIYYLKAHRDLSCPLPSETIGSLVTAAKQQIHWAAASFSTCVLACSLSPMQKHNDCINTEKCNEKLVPILCIVKTGISL